VRFHAEAQRERYDAVVVGSGVAGLTAAALLAKSGSSVLVVERHDRVGGYAHAFRRGPYLFDSAVHMVGGCRPVPYEGGAIVHQLLQGLGIEDRCHFEPIDPVYAAVYPDLVLHAAPDFEDFVRGLAREFPGEEKGLRQLAQECLNLRRETHRAAELGGPYEVMRAPARFPTLLRYRRATLADALDAHLESPRAKAAFASLWPYVGLPPSRASFVYFATMLVSYVADRAYSCRGSFQRFAEALSSVVEESGGEVLLRTVVRRIETAAGGARGVVLENGQRIAAPVVIAACDARQALTELVGLAALPDRLRASLRRLTPSISAFVSYLATDLPFENSGFGHETFFFGSWDHEQSFRSSEALAPNWFTMTVPTLADPSLAPIGQHLVVLTTLVPYAAPRGWRDEKPRLARHLLGLAETRVSGLRESLRFEESASPRTMERYTRASDGAIYGFELSPRQVGTGRLPQRTPIDGLFLAGHWTQPGGGIYGVVFSGIEAARQVLGEASAHALFARL
jgi:prolycopene isomerase